MTSLLVATRSVGKQREFRRLLSSLDRPIVFPDDIGLRYHPDEESIEVHDSFEANAGAKAHWFRDRSGLDTVADDSGLMVDALSGAPGVWSKRLAGATGSERQVARRNNDELLKMLRGVPAEARGARFHCVLVLAHADPSRTDLVVTGFTEGRILDAPLGDGGFGYDPLFWAADLNDSLGRASAAHKDAVSHRARAARVLVDALAAD